MEDVARPNPFPTLYAARLRSLVKETPCPERGQNVVHARVTRVGGPLEDGRLRRAATSISSGGGAEARRGGGAEGRRGEKTSLKNRKDTISLSPHLHQSYTFIGRRERC